jgi:hypothetical protein
MVQGLVKNRKFGRRALPVDLTRPLAPATALRKVWTTGSPGRAAPARTGIVQTKT